MTAAPDAAFDASLDWLAAQRRAMQAALVDIDSNSHDKAGTDRVAQALVGAILSLAD